MPFSTRIVDMTSSRPAAGIRVTLDHWVRLSWTSLFRGVSGVDGRVVPSGLPATGIDRGIYRLTYDTNAYFAEFGQASAYSEIVVALTAVDEMHALELSVLIAPCAYTVCRTTLPSRAAGD